ncbi:MAG: hypothetical protein GY863_03380 [bacterium]|nr:hypothetical protein [bacterium]
MSKIFWTIICLILALSALSLILYSGEPEVVTEPLPEDISNMITELRTSVDEMGISFDKMNEVTALARAAGNNRNGRDWFTEAENLYAAMVNDLNNKVNPLNNRLTNSELTESAEKQIGEFMARARGYISNEKYKNLLVTKNSAGIRVNTNDWLRLARMYQSIDNSYDRDMGLKTLAKILEPINVGVADNVYDMIEAPFVNALYKAENPGSVDFPSLTEGIDDTYLKLQVLIKYGRNQLSDNVVHALENLLDEVDDNIEKGYFAARTLVQLPGIPDDHRGPFFTAIGNVDNLLMAETKLTLVENGGAEGAIKTAYMNDVKSLLPLIEQNYPRENLHARLVMQKMNDEPDAILEELEEIESVTLKDAALLYIATHMNYTIEGKLNTLVEAMHDDYSKLAAKLHRFNRGDMDQAQAEAYLLTLEGYLESINETQPKIDVTIAWGKVNPLIAKQKMVGFGTADKVYVASALAEVLNDNSQLSVILDDVYTELSPSRIFEPIEKSQLLRVLADAVKAVDSQFASRMLEEGYNLVMGQ